MKLRSVGAAKYVRVRGEKETEGTWESAAWAEGGMFERMHFFCERMSTSTVLFSGECMDDCINAGLALSC